MQLNKKLLFVLSLLLVLGGQLVGCSDTSTPGKKADEQGEQAENNSKEKVIEMNLNSIFPSTHHLSVDAFDPWMKLVEEKTEGRIKVNLYYGGTLGSSASVWQDIQGGVYDVGGPAPVPYFLDTELFPLTISSLPFAFSDVESAVNIMSKFAEKYSKEASEKAILMGMVNTESYNLNSIKPITKIEDLKGLKVRVTGKIDSDLVKAWGATPVSIPNEDLYGSLDKKTIDAALFTLTTMVSSALYEVAPNALIINEATSLLIPVMNHDFYNKLPDDLKELFDSELNPKLAELMNESLIKEGKIKFEKAKEHVEGIGEIIIPSSEELQKFKAPAKEQWENWVEDANKRGYPGDEMMEEFKRLLQEEGLTLPF